jgi:hypothetical protein
METFTKSKSPPLRRAHFVGTSVVVTIDPMIVKRLQIDDSTFFIQKPVQDGILMEMKKLADADGTSRTTLPYNLGE